jgi:peptidoglycan/LPS O-acetylase OafA/YrhL
VAFLFLAGNWYAVAAAHLGSPIRPLWSISVEEQFYLLWPVIARLGGRRWIAVLSLLLLPLASLRVYMLTRGGPDSCGAMWFDSLVQFQFFALGALLALALRGRVFTLRPAIRVLAFSAGLSSWLLTSFVFPVDCVDTMPSPVSVLVGYGLVAWGCLLLFGAFLGASADWFPRPLVYLGKISYGLYVFHMLSLDITGALLWPSGAERASVQTTWGISLLIARALLEMMVALAGTVVLAALSYQFLERPFLKLKQRFTLVPSRKV